jgi:hypothetical protein
MTKVIVCLKEDLSNVIGSTSDLENVRLKIHNKSLWSAIISPVKAETGNLKVDLIETTMLLNIEANLVEFAD